LSCSDPPRSNEYPGRLFLSTWPLKINHTYVQRIIIEFAFQIYIIPSLVLLSSLSSHTLFSSADRPLAQGGQRRSKLHPQAVCLYNILQAESSGKPLRLLAKRHQYLHVLPFSVGLPVLDHLLLRWAADVVDLHEVLVHHRLFLCPTSLLVMTQPVLEVVPDVHPLLPGRSCAVPWSEVLW
jgi:hypothetical protein